MLPQSKGWLSILRFTLAFWSVTVLRRFAYFRVEKLSLRKQPETDAVISAVTDYGWGLPTLACVRDYFDVVC